MRPELLKPDFSGALAREAITNLLRHSAATQVAISLTTEEPP